MHSPYGDWAHRNDSELASCVRMASDGSGRQTHIKSAEPLKWSLRYGDFAERLNRI